MVNKSRLPVGVLGATGAVGQKFVWLLSEHPWFELTALTASSRSAGRSYGEAVSWRQAVDLPEAAARLPVRDWDDELDCSLVFSALDAGIAGEAERLFAQRGAWVFSNARNHRMDPDVPLLIPELNPDHLDLIEVQRKRRAWSGAIVTNANCSTIILALALGPLERAFGLKKVHVATCQAVSGAGYPGVPSLDILGNVIPYIAGEEEKIESEPLKILGRLRKGRVEAADFAVSAQANRVAVEDGHLIGVSASFKNPPKDDEEVLACWDGFRGHDRARGLPSSPLRPIAVRRQPDRPQPKLDVMAEKGMGVTVGRLRRCPLLDHKFVALGHNTIRGAAGASILNAELTFREGLLGD